MSEISFNKQTTVQNRTCDFQGHIIGLLNILNQNFRIKKNILIFPLTLYKLKLEAKYVKFNSINS